ncbi:Tyrosinase [Ascochyta rabiei]|uniref:Tyrosinase n=1 Tax=Didymella rabiei TaxID=5454 RepID=UPI00220BC69B|nr:Tyrosinase [Ascochyta rabiei]UPX15104.1 Tyrosinase [Ascochyta rabiei]
MYFLLASAALATSCSALTLPWGSRATVSGLLPPLPLDHFDTPKYARPLSLEEALSGANASVTTILDLQDAKNKFPPLVIPTNLKLPGSAHDLAEALEGFQKRQSTCSNVRVRTEWDNYSNSDRQAYIDSIKCMMKKPPSGQFSVSRNRYDDLVGLHQTLTPNVHGNAKFLLWHRYFVWTFEQLLRDECGFDRELPWFDETRYAGRFADSSIFSPQWYGSIKVGGQCVTDGQFANLAINYGPGTGNTPHCLARNNDDSQTANTGNAIVDACNSRSTYADMASCAEGGAHAWGHNGIGAVMKDVYASPADPVFFLVCKRYDCRDSANQTIAPWFHRSQLPHLAEQWRQSAYDYCRGH